MKENNSQKKERKIGKCRKQVRKKERQYYTREERWKE